MTIGVTPTEMAATAALRRAAIRATHAFSVHETQPWRMELGSDRLEIHADPARRMEALDPSGRQLMLSLGAAVFAARAALAASGFDAAVSRLPDPSRPNLAARISIEGPAGPGMHHPAGSYDELVERRQSYPQYISDGQVPAGTLAAFEEATTREGAWLQAVRDVQTCESLNRLCRQAREIQLVDPACRAELRVYAGRLDAKAAIVPSPVRPCMLILGTDRDDRLSWLRAGEALERLLLEVTRHGFAGHATTCITEVTSTRINLEKQLELAWFPHVVIQVGRASLTPQPRRRRLVEVLFETV